MIKKLKIWWLKRLLRNAYKDVMKNKTPGGDLIRTYISIDLWTKKERFNRIADKLSEIDSTAPLFRFKTNSSKIK